MGEIFNKVLDIGIEVFGANPLEILFILVLLSVFLWLSKEFRTQQIEERGFQKEQIEKSLSAFSHILFEGNTYKPGENINLFLQSVYSAFPFIDHRVSKEMLLVLEDDINDEHKIKKILQISKKEMFFLSSSSNDYLFKTSLLSEDVEKFIIKLRIIFGPVIASGFIIYSVLLVVTISFSGENHFWMFVKPISFILACLLVPFSIDLISEKRLTYSIGIYLSGIFLSALLLVESSGYYLYLFLILFIGFFFGFIFYVYRINQKNEVIHQ